ncbi:unnamed protein product, partial [Prunus brigantina]
IRAFPARGLGGGRRFGGKWCFQQHKSARAMCGPQQKKFAWASPWGGPARVTKRVLG